MAHMCVCAICGKRFDRDKVQAVRHNGRRYSHAACEPDNKDLVPLVVKNEGDEKIAQLKGYINQIYGEKANWPLIMRQIKKFTSENGFSISGILKSLVWFYEVKHNKVNDSNGGIGIVEYCYKDAYNYYLAIYKANEANKDKQINTTVKEITIKPPKARNYLCKSIIDLEGWTPSDEE